MIASVVRAGWLNLRRDRAALMLSFIVPIVFFSIFAGIFGAQKSKTPKTTVVIADLDRSDSSRRLVEALKRESALGIVLSPKKALCVRCKSAEECGRAPTGNAGDPEASARRVSAGAAATDRPSADVRPADPIADQVVGGLLRRR
jgi:ABC-2 type transport system permease protein